MKLDSYLALIHIDPALADAVELVGSRWSFVALVGDILRGRPAATSVPPERLAELAARLRAHFPFNWASYSTDPRGSFSNEISLLLNDQNILGSPSAFVPFLIELEALVRNSTLANQDTSTRLGAYTVAVLCAASMRPAILPAAAPVLSDVVRVFARIGAAIETVSALRDGVHTLASELISRGDGGTSAFVVGHPELLEAEYEALVYEAELRDLTDPQSRAAVAQDAISFLETVFGPALDRRAGLIRRGTTGADHAALIQSELAHRHRTLTWKAALATARGQWTPDTVNDWVDLAARYDAIEDPINAAGAISAAIDRCAEVIESRPDQMPVFAGTLVTLANDLDARLSSIRGVPNEDRLELLERCIRARVLAREVQQATPSLQAALETLAEARKGADTYRDAYLLRKADNYLGFALRLDLLGAQRPDQHLDSAHQSILGRAFPPAAAIDDAGVLRAHVYRTACALGAVTATDSGWIPIESAHELARSLDLAFKQCLEDIALWHSTGCTSNTDAQWTGLFDRMLGQSNLRRLLPMLFGAHRRLRIEVDGHGIHLPLTGLALAAEPGFEAVLTQRLSISGRTPLVPDIQPVVVLNGFQKSDPLHAVIAGYAAALNADHRPVASAQDVVHGLSTASRLILLGCHGGQDAARGELRLALGSSSVLALKLFEKVSLPRAASVFCFTCFAGAGQLAAGGEWASLPDLFLRAGARAVVANRFPVWHDPNSGAAIRALLVDLAAAASSADVWETAHATTRWMSAQIAQRASPRTWLGWGTWTCREWVAAAATLR